MSDENEHKSNITGEDELAAADEISLPARYASAMEILRRSFDAQVSRGSDGSTHAGHRKRLRESAKNDSDLSGLSDVELVELLLSFLIPQKDTNVLAHKLIDKFGSVIGVLCAPRDELISVAHITAQVAAMLPLTFALCLTGGQNKIKLKNRADAADFFGVANLGKPNVGTYVAFMDDSLTVRAVEYFDGDGVPARDILSSACKYHVKYVFVAKREPELFPQSYNIAAAVGELGLLLADMGATMLDYLIFSDYGYYTVGAAPREPGWYPMYIFVPAVRYMRSPDFYGSLISQGGKLGLYAGSEPAEQMDDLAAQLCAAAKV